LSGPVNHDYVRGALFGLAAVTIWSSWIVAAQLGLKTSLSPWDITAIRFGVAGLFVLPYLLRKGLAIDRLGWGGLSAIVLGGGAPMVLLANAGLLYAPAAHAGALFPGVLPLQVAILAAFFANESFTAAKRLGISLILLGAAGIVCGTGGTIGSQQNIGHGLFLVAGFLWACYTVVMRIARLEGLHAASIAAVGSLLVYVPAYAFGSGMSLMQASWRDVALQGLVQGVLTAVISLQFYGKAVSILGASRGAAFAALCPAMTALIAIPVLGQWPTVNDWTAIIVISVGVYIVSGGTFIGRVGVRRRSRPHVHDPNPPDLQL
jgi:drug/metabolite transporter (DMT)-like permease